MIPLKRQATSPIFHAKTGSFVSWYTGPMIKNIKANRLTVFIP
jgi:hypothetical protein